MEAARSWTLEKMAVDRSANRGRRHFCGAAGCGEGKRRKLVLERVEMVDWLAVYVKSRGENGGLSPVAAQIISMLSGGV